ncbi:MAG: hypothetical protein PHF25_02320 [Candidatus Margulisbacteria bacterium]|nr:hypothetical protein [Candidatus Margulisiibacteriota bacterium]
MEYISLFIIIPLLFTLHYFLYTEKTKIFLQKTLGNWFMSYLYRFLYAIITIVIILIFIKVISSIQAPHILNMQDNLSNIVFLIMDTFRLIFLFLIVESVWTLGMANIFGIKHLKNLFSKNKDKFNLDFIVTPFNVKGLYLRHRHPLLFYLVLFILFDRTLTLLSIYSLIFLSAYYILFTKMVEAQLVTIYQNDFNNYQKGTNFFLPQFKKYPNEPTKK